MSYANLSDMLAERGISLNRSTIYRWFIEYSPKFRKKLRRNYQLIQTDSSWQLDETYVKVKGKWNYLYRAINKQGGRLRVDVKQRQVKALNNDIESDHAPIKTLIVATGGFKLRNRAWSTIQGFESLRMLNKG